MQLHRKISNGKSKLSFQKFHFFRKFFSGTNQKIMFHLQPNWNFRNLLVNGKCPQLRVGAGFRVFKGLGCGIRKGNRAQYGISILTWQALRPKASRNVPIVRIAVLTAPYPVRFCQTYRLLPDYVSIMQLYEVLVSDINGIIPFPIFSKAVSVISTPRSFLLFLIFQLFQKHVACLARMAMIVICRKKFATL